jgi:ankyrin repeat protein
MEQKSTPIRGHIKVFFLLIDHGAKVNAAPAVKNGRTALDGAAEHGRLDMVHMLLQAGAECERRGEDGYESTRKLAERGAHWGVAELLTNFWQEKLDSFESPWAEWA